MILRHIDNLVSILLESEDEYTFNGVGFAVLLGSVVNHLGSGLGKVFHKLVTHQEHYFDSSLR